MRVNCTDIYVKLYYSRTGKDTNNMFLMVLRSFFFQYNHKHILTACQDRNVRVYMVGNGKHIKTFKGSVGEDGTLIKVVLDRSGVYLSKLAACRVASFSVKSQSAVLHFVTDFAKETIETNFSVKSSCRVAS